MHERLGGEGGDGSEMLAIGSKHRLVLDDGSGDECIARLQTVAQGERALLLGGTECDGRR